MSSGTTCAVMGCSNSWRKSKKQGLKTRFFRFPKDPAVLKVWVERCRRPDKINPKAARVCSDHFRKEDFELNFKAELLGLPERKPLLKTAVPSVNLHERYGVSNTPAAQKRRERQQQKEAKERHSELIRNALLEAEEKNITYSEKKVFTTDQITLVQERRNSGTVLENKNNSNINKSCLVNQIEIPDESILETYSAIMQDTDSESEEPNQANISCSSTQVASFDESKLMSELMKSEILQNAVLQVLSLNKTFSTDKSCSSAHDTSPPRLKLIPKEIKSVQVRRPLLEVKKNIVLNTSSSAHEHATTNKTHSEPLPGDIHTPDNHSNVFCSNSHISGQNDSENCVYKKLFEDLEVKYQLMEREYVTKLTTAEVKANYFHSYKKTNFKLIKSIEGLREKLKESKEEIKELNSQIRKLTSAENHELLHQLQSGLRKVFTKNELDLLLSRQKQVCWTSKECEKAFKFKQLSNRAYHYARRELKYPLPSVSCLNKWARKNPNNDVVRTISRGLATERSLITIKEKSTQGDLFLLTVSNSEEHAIVKVKSGDSDVEIIEQNPVDHVIVDDVSEESEKYMDQGPTNDKINEMTNGLQYNLITNSEEEISSNTTHLIEVNITPVSALKAANREIIIDKEHSYSRPVVFF